MEVRRAHLVFSLIIAITLVVASCTSAITDPPRPREAATTQPGPSGTRASWVVRENQQPGTTDWQIHGTPSGSTVGYLDRSYAAPGQTSTLRVSTNAPTFHVEAYRMGDYQGKGARLVWRSPETPGTKQPPCPVTPGTNEVSCAGWSPSLPVPVTHAWPQGDYLLKLVSTDGQASYVPLTVWDPNSHATYLIKNDVLTWQAWNPYGGFNYYTGKGQCPRGVYPLCTRSRAVSFDRPYDTGYNGGKGTGDFLSLELPLVQWAEKQGLDLSYATDLTVVDHPDLLTRHRAIFSLGHDECWSARERQAAVTAHQRGVNIAFFGASAMLRHVRLQPSPLGPHRQEVDYRDASQDPLNGHGPAQQVTGNTWSSPPARWPEDDFVGESYNGFLSPDAPPAALTITNAASWIYAGTGLHNGQSIPGVIRSDVDSLDLRLSHTPNLDMLGHSTLDARGSQPRTRHGDTFHSDMTYYTDPTSKAGVWDSGTNNWIPALKPCTGQTPCPAHAVGAITGNLLHAFGTGPAGTAHPTGR